MATTKVQLRTEMKARRAAMSDNEVARASEAIRRQVLGLEALESAASVFVYVSVRNEPDTRRLIVDLLELGKRISVPGLAHGGIMKAQRISCLDELVSIPQKAIHIPAPRVDAPIEPRPDLILVPGLAFTETGQRLGMGGGYYDRYLADHPHSAAIGLGYDWQVLDALPYEPHDRPVRWLVTESRVLSCGP